MSVTLCIDTSGAYCSLALAREGEVFVDSRELARQHNQRLLAMLDDLFLRAKADPSDVTLLGYVHGPGSFTGIRLSAAAVQAIALVSEAPVATLPMGKLWAMQLDLDANTLLVSCTKSRADLYYLAGFRGQTCVHPDDLYDQVPDWAQVETLVLAGEQPAWWPGNPAFHPQPVMPETLLALTESYHEQGKSMAAEAALPLYLATDAPWQKANQQTAKQNRTEQKQAQ